jgi:hypothetical protein
MNNDPTRSASEPISFRVNCDIRKAAVKPILAVAKAFGAEHYSLSGEGVRVVGVAPSLFDLLSACIEGITKLYPDGQKAGLYLH